MAQPYQKQHYVNAGTKWNFDFTTQSSDPIYNLTIINVNKVGETPEDPSSWSGNPSVVGLDECALINQSLAIYPSPRSYFCVNATTIALSKFGLRNMTSGDIYNIAVEYVTNKTDIQRNYTVTVVNCTTIADEMNVCPEVPQPSLTQIVIRSSGHTKTSTLENRYDRRRFIIGVKAYTIKHLKGDIINIRFLDWDFNFNFTLGNDEDDLLLERPIYEPISGPKTYIATNLMGRWLPSYLYFLIQDYEDDYYYCEEAQCLKAVQKYEDKKCHESVESHIHKWYSKCLGKQLLYSDLDTVESLYLEISLCRVEYLVPRMRFQANFLSLSRTLSISNKYFGPLKVRDREILLYFAPGGY